MTLSKNALKVLKKRYFSKGETWEKLCRRVANRVAEDEPTPAARKKWAQKYYDLIHNRTFLPNSPTLRNFGRNNGCGSACFVMPLEDSRKAIFKTLSDVVDVQAYGGGTGMDFSNIRPRGDRVSTTGGLATGPIAIMGIFDYTVGDIIKQGGTRQGANMGILRVDHPDIENFIASKTLEGDLKNFNISVGVTDAFMQAVEKNKAYDLVFSGKRRGSVKARSIWHSIVEAAWRNGEPGIVFLDTINRNNPLSAAGQISATNPCGEQPLLPYSSCNLGSINLNAVIMGDWVSGKARINWKKLKATTTTAVRFLDSVISTNHYPLVEIEKTTKKFRQIGLGIMGFADLCIKLHLRYGSDEAVQVARKVMAVIYNQALETSQKLGAARGPAPFFSEFKTDLPARRNGALTSIAPTGTLSVLADCSSGCEPHFAFNYTKGCLEGEKLKMIPAVFQEWLQQSGDKRHPNFFVTADEVSVDEHISIQAALQGSGVDAGVSKTINAPYHTSKKEVSRAFFKAWKAQCKGITFYRQGSRDVQALYDEVTAIQDKDRRALQRGELKKRPRATTGPSLKMKTACGKLYVDPHFDNDGVIEVFIRTEGGGCTANTKALGILLSYCLRAGIAPEALIKAMKSVHCTACTRAILSGKDVEVNSCAAGMGKGLDIAL
ncbi:MAG: adenosylcobalamin-dependent ribonucleoside-diphosphate reductase, partial [Desulfobacterales bacterium]|nr:adenosylcobalamin-dependent ribonucleoside-diphosphate reductase [Desulfobacterales bacterium]